MELSFIANAIRRHLWVVILVTVAGLLAGVLLGSDTEPQYESRAVLLVQPPVDGRGITVDADRYVAGQVSVLSSQGMAERVAARLDDGTTLAFIAGAVRLDHQIDTNVVHIVVSTPDPERSQVIGATYVEEYFESIRQQIDDTQRPGLDQLNERVERLREELEANDEAREEAMAPYLAQENPPLPEAVAPHLETQDRILTSEINTALQALSDLETNARLRVSSEVAQQATLPTEPKASGPNLMLGVGLIGGFGLGLFLAILFARISPLVIGDDHAEEILEYPMVGRVPGDQRAQNQRSALLEELPPSVSGMIGRLAVRAEAVPRQRQNLALVVTSTRRGAGTTSLASMMARRFAEGGARVLLVDADRHDPELRSLFMTEQSEAPESLRSHPEGAVEEEESEVLAFQPTELENLLVADLQVLAGTPRLLPAQIADVVERATSVVDVVVFDGGPLLSAASTMHLTRTCNVVVLAVPEHQEARELEVVAHEVRGRSVLPVWTPTHPGLGFIARLPLVGPLLAKRAG